MNKKTKLVISSFLDVLYAIIIATFISLLISKSNDINLLFIDFNFISSIISLLFIAIFSLNQFLLIKNIDKKDTKKYKRKRIFTYILYYLATSLSLFSSFVYLTILLPKNTTLFNLNNLFLNVISPLILLINFLFFILKGEYIFLDSLFSLIIPFIYEVVLLSFILTKKIDSPYYFFSLNNNKIYLIIIYALIGLLINYILSSILLMYHNNGQDLTESKFKLSRRSLLLDRLLDFKNRKK